MGACNSQKAKNYVLTILNKSVLWHHIYLKLASLFEKKTHILAFLTL
jgi:hypothetical protein